MLRTLRHALLTLILIALCLTLGKWLSAQLGLMPGALYGLLLFTGILHSGWIDKDTIGQVITQCIRFMPLVFLPVCVGIVQYGTFLRASGWQFIVVISLSSCISLVVVALLSKRTVKNEHDGSA